MGFFSASIFHPYDPHLQLEAEEPAEEVGSVRHRHIRRTIHAIERFCQRWRARKGDA